MTKVMFFLLAALALVMVAAVLAYQFGGIWGLVVAIIAIFVALRFVPKLFMFVMLRTLKKSMDAQGEALRGATIEVHEIQPADKPAPHEYEDEFFDQEYDPWEGEPDEDLPIDPLVQEMFYHGRRNWFHVDMTIFPEMRSDGRPTEYLPWYPAMICLLGPQRPAPPKMPMGLDHMAMIDGYAIAAKATVWQDDAWVDDYEHEQFGPQRIRLHVGVKPGERLLRVAYVSELIGELEMPNNE